MSYLTNYNTPHCFQNNSWNWGKTWNSQSGKYQLTHFAKMVVIWLEFRFPSRHAHRARGAQRIPNHYSLLCSALPNLPLPQSTQLPVHWIDMIRILFPFTPRSARRARGGCTAISCSLQPTLEHSLWLTRASINTFACSLNRMNITTILVKYVIWQI